MCKVFDFSRKEDRKILDTDLQSRSPDSHLPLFRFVKLKKLDFSACPFCSRSMILTFILLSLLFSAGDVRM